MKAKGPGDYLIDVGVDGRGRIWRKCKDGGLQSASPVGTSKAGCKLTLPLTLPHHDGNYEKYNDVRRETEEGVG